MDYSSSPHFRDIEFTLRVLVFPYTQFRVNIFMFEKSHYVLSIDTLYTLSYIQKT